MFLNALEKQNSALIDAAVHFWRNGDIGPDCYVIDVDLVLENARLLQECAEKIGLSLYLMSKQFGRNPLLCKLLLEKGYQGIVAVDFKEARQLWQHGLPIAHIGHLVQTPANMIDEIISQRPEVITVYSIEKAREISIAALRQQHRQPLLLKVQDNGDVIYPGQEAGFLLAELPDVINKISRLAGVEIIGVTHFPCMLFNEQRQSTEATPNLATLAKAKNLLEQHGIEVRQMNAASATCIETLPKLAAAGVTHTEPGHALTGTQPANQYGGGPEKIAMLYLSEISHSQDNTSFCYGGGYYRRGHLQNALVLDGQWQRSRVLPIDSDSIDYTLPLTGLWPVSSPVIMCFRTQIFVTRSDVALISGIQMGNPQLLGVFDSLGNNLTRSHHG